MKARTLKVQRGRRPILESLEERLVLSGLNPTSVTLGNDSPLYASKSQTLPLTITLPPSSVSTKVDVALLLDDTGSFASFSQTVEGIFSNLVTSLQAALPGVDFGFGVAKFEDYGGPGTVLSEDLLTGRPFILDQPIITAATAAAHGTDLHTLITAALSARGAGTGGDTPEPNFEALYQIATGAGFDGNGSGSKLDSGPAGSLKTANTPGDSGDVPPFSSNVGLTSGSLGGIGWRPDALHIVLMAADTAPVAAFSGSSIPAEITGVGGVTVPTGSLESAAGRVGFVSTVVEGVGTGPQPAVVPKGGATVQETINALNAAGIEVIGMGPGSTPSTATGPATDPSIFLSALARLTGALDPKTGQPLVFSTMLSNQALTDSMVGAISASAAQPINIGMSATGLPAGLNFALASPRVVSKVGPAGSATFDVTLSLASLPFHGTFDANFVNMANGSVMGTVPFTINLSEPTVLPPAPVVPPDAPPDAPPVPPTVVSGQRVGVHSQPTSLVITFSQPMDVRSVQDVNNYILLGQRSGRDPIVSATYDAATHSVTLHPKKRLRLFFNYYLQIKAQGTHPVRSAEGVALDGDYGGFAGIDFVGIVRKSTITPAVPNTQGSSATAVKATSAPRRIRPHHLAVVSSAHRLTPSHRPRSAPL
jgi:hypothetical protein